MTNFNILHPDLTLAERTRIKHYQRAVEALWSVQIVDGKKMLCPTESTRELIKFIQIKLYTYSLLKYYQEIEILNEAIARGAERCLYYDKPIDNLPSWLRTTSFHIISERSRYHRRIICLEEPSLEVQSISHCEDPLVAEEDLRIMKGKKAKLSKALDELKPAERQLINLRYVEEKSWAEIHEQLGEKVTQAALRKRLARIHKKLRKSISPDL